ncbi:chemotaxis protein CheD [bacterium]|nr:chemotaxis protein CheD [bacterium]MBU1072633.1 chemotaxis protein CheD [bacterium]MBU1675535.1 chemotaxis protein CheD [bacterium]
MLTVGISDMVVTNDSSKVIITYSLGSCVGLSLHDSVAGVGGMVHCMLPLSKIDPEKAEMNPCMFVDTGVPRLLQEVYDMGATRKNLVAKVAGAGSPLGKNQVFKIGKRNYTVLRKVLWKNNILIKGENVGGSSARTLILNVLTGRTVVKMDGKELEL